MGMATTREFLSMTDRTTDGVFAAMSIVFGICWLAAATVGAVFLLIAVNATTNYPLAVVVGVIAVVIIVSGLYKALREMLMAVWFAVGL